MSKTCVELPPSLRPDVAAAAAVYAPRTLPDVAWQAWRPRVLPLVAAAYGSSPTVFKRGATWLCLLLDLVKPDLDAGWDTVLSDAGLAAVDAHCARTGNGEARRARQVLERLRLVALHPDLAPSTSVRSPQPAKPQIQSPDVWLAVLPVLAREAPRRAARRAAKDLLTHLRVVRDADSWRRPFHNTNRWAALRDAGAERGITAPLDWYTLRAARIRQELAQPNPAAACLLTVGFTQAGWVRLLARHETVDRVPQPRLLRGDKNAGQERRWQVKAPHVPEKSTTVTSPTRRSSKAEARRRAAQAREAKRTPAPVLPDDLEQFLVTWSPKDVDDSRWLPVRDLVLDAMRRSQYKTVDTMMKRIRVAAAFVMWAREAGYDLTIDAMFTSAAIEEFTRRSGAARTTRGTNRSWLRALARHISAAPDAPTRTQVLSHSDVRPPYTENEVELIRTLVGIAVNDQTRRQMQVGVALGLGAGLDSGDIRELRVRDIDDHGPEGIHIRVQGRNARQVWMRQDYEDMLRAGIAGLKPGHLVLGRMSAGKNALPGLYADNATADGSLRIQQSRLRNTWLVTVMTEPIPLWDILDAAGLSGARTLTELLPFIEPLGDPALLLRGAA